MIYKMYVRASVLLLAVSLVPAVLSKTRRFSRNQTNSLSRARCDLTCFETSRASKSKIQECRQQCRAQEQKPGTCPLLDSPKWAAACVEACNTDAQCDGVQRCCRQGCGASCSEPIDLLTLSGLPAMPIMEEAKEKRRGKVQLRWSDGVGDLARAVPGRILYVVEEQHHLGPKYEELRLGEWSSLLRTNKTKVSLKEVLKPGRWYRFRVAAISSEGTRGFSAPNAPFTPRRGPRAPPKPKKLRVRPVRMENGTVTVKLEWKEPQSDLPVMRYKVFWSRRARGIGGELDSVLVNHQNVPKTQNHIEIKDLQPNSMYFLQVQTISQFGLGKLRSEKAEIFYNTTVAGNGEFNQRWAAASFRVSTSCTALAKPPAKRAVPPEPLQRKENRIKGLKLQKIVWYNNKLRARISWEPVPSVHEHTGRYYVNWRTVHCQNPKYTKKKLSATTEQTTFEIYELEYHCSYMVNVNKNENAKVPESELQVNVPGCSYFKKKVNVTAIDCDRL